MNVRNWSIILWQVLFKLQFAITRGNTEIMTAPVLSHCKCNDVQFYHDSDDFIYSNQSTRAVCTPGLNVQEKENILWKRPEAFLAYWDQGQVYIHISLLWVGDPHRIVPLEYFICLEHCSGDVVWGVRPGVVMIIKTGVKPVKTGSVMDKAMD